MAGDGGLVEKGKIRSIGVSNFTREKIESLSASAEIKPAVNQIEAHGYLQQPKLLDWCKQQVRALVSAAVLPAQNSLTNAHSLLGYYRGGI